MDPVEIIARLLIEVFRLFASKLLDWLFNNWRRPK